MNTTNVKLYSCDYGQARTWLVAALFVLGNIALPQLCHLIPDGGRILLPVYFFTLVGAWKFGWRAGIIIALASPLANSLLFGMPAAAALPVIMVKSSLLALAAGLAAARFRRASLLLIAATVLMAHIAGSLFEWAYTGSIIKALQDFRLGAAGIVLQIVGCRLFLRYVIRK